MVGGVVPVGISVSVGGGRVSVGGNVSVGVSVGGGGVSLGGTSVAVAVAVGGSGVEVGGDGVFVGRGVSVSNSILMGVAEGVLVDTFGAHSRPPATRVVE